MSLHGFLVLCALVLAWPSAAHAQDNSADATGQVSLVDRWFSVGLKAGLYVPGIGSDLSTQVDFALDGGVLLPFLGRRLSAVVEVAYAAPGNSGSRSDPRIGEGGGPVQWQITNQQARLGLGGAYRFSPPGALLVPYVGLLGQIVLLRTRSDGTGGTAALGEHVERSTELGAAILGGGELRLGPGVALVEISFSSSDLPHALTGDTVTAALAMRAGYRLFL